MKLDSWLWLPCMTHTLVKNGTSVEIGKYGPIFMFNFMPKGVSKNAFCVGSPIIAVWVLMFGPVVYINTPFSSDFDADKEMILENFRKLQQGSKETSEEAYKPSPPPFIQGNIRIVPPVEQVKTKEGSTPTDGMVNDGGTTWLTIIDSKGKKFDVYFDRRFRVENGRIVGNEPGTIYLNAYPGDSNAVMVINQAEFRSKVLKWVTFPTE
jgi:hypothetical protein